MPSSLTGIPTEFDVIVIGGGPAGATTAGLLAKRGHQVLILDRERFPRYHVGESLIPVVMAPMKEMGLTERLEQRGFERKYGGTFVWGNEQAAWDFSFVDGGDYPFAYHTRRADLDSVILDRARELGAYVVEDATVKEPVEEDGRVTGVRFTVRGGKETYEARSAMVVDASGQARVLTRKYSEIDWHDKLRNVAVWTYFDNCERLPGDQYSNILVEGIENGWFWGIPLDKGTISVGFVTPSTVAGESDQGLEQLYRDEIEKTTKLKHMLRDARQSAGFRSARDWSYTNQTVYGKGWAAVGDAAAFVDPLISTGVALATTAGSILSRVIDKVLQYPEIEETALKRYATAYLSFFNEVRSFVERFYDRSLMKEDYHKLAQSVIDPEQKNTPANDFVTLLAGLRGKHLALDITVDDLVPETPASASASASAEN
ncbi:NAD(P)/FAD-dependent oxidoreductase [Streptomyces ardesiacus]|uniref:NAD(P)/FAD-dependent oxidoreductase n=1 Tax=Streptomyces ardesiacus TaxID=285564 RepID=A0ABW8HFR0_9ACTN